MVDSTYYYVYSTYMTYETITNFLVWDVKFVFIFMAQL